MAISSLPKNSFWNPPGEPGVTMHATDGVERPVRKLHDVLMRMALACCIVAYAARNMLS